MNNKTSDIGNSEKELQTLLDQADAYCEHGAYTKALELYSKVLKHLPDDPVIWNNQGVAFQQNEQYKQAIQSYEKAVDLDPSYEQAWMNLAALYYQQNKYDQAIECYIKVLEITPKNSDAKHWKNYIEHLKNKEIKKLNKQYKGLFKKADTNYQKTYDGMQIIGILDGDVPNQYQIVKILEGGMGYVLIAYDTYSQEKLVALKTYKDDVFHNNAILNRFETEAYTWISLGYHPNIVQAQTVWYINRRPYIIMEYVKGKNLSALIPRNGMNIKSLLTAAIQVCDGMQYAFDSLELIHRDIKPQNILVDTTGVVKITDFGIASTFHALETYGLTPEYASPEQFQGLQVDTRSDIYSFGIVLYEMVTGQTPFQIPQKYTHAIPEVKYNFFKEMHCNNSSTNPMDIQSDCSRKLAYVIMECLQKNPDYRIQSFTELKNELLSAYLYEVGEEYAFKIKKRTLGYYDWNLKGIAFYHLNKFDEALPCYDKSIALNPDWEHSWYNKGLLYDDQKKYEAAIQCYDKALKINPKFDRAWYNKALSLEYLHQDEEALDCYNKLLRLNPSYEKGWFHKGYILLNHNRYEEALECNNRALQLNPNYDRAWNNKGWCLENLDKQDEALKCYDKALIINPKFKNPWFNKIEILQNQRRYHDALDCVENFLKIYPNNRDAQQLRNQIIQKIRF